MRAAAAYWIVVAAIYVALGAWFPQYFLLGFWEALPYLAAASWLQRRLVGRER
jgi:hypothetical protein